MKILLVSTLKRAVTAQVTASRSRVIYELANGLVKKGHRVSLLGTGDSIIPGVTTIPLIPKAWVDLPAVENPYFREMATLVSLARKVVELQSDFDIIHNHTYPEFFLPLIETELNTPFVTTIHIQGEDYIDQTLSLFKKTHFVSISNAHRALFKKARIFKVVRNGVDTNLYVFNEKKEDYLLWLGRLSKAKDVSGDFMDPKGVKWAIQLARETGSRLLLSGNVEDMEFYNKEVKPNLSDKIQWIGPVSHEQSLTKEQVVNLMQKAKAFLMTINWYEPFGLVMAEAMSCGTPVVGFDRGSVSELVVNGKTGFVVKPQEGIEGLKKAFSQISTINPLDCRKHVEDNFSIEIMVANYEKVYQEILESKK